MSSSTTQHVGRTYLQEPQLKKNVDRMDPSQRFQAIETVKRED
jgi:hypothetical protein